MERVDMENFFLLLSKYQNSKHPVKLMGSRCKTEKRILLHTESD